MAKKQFKAESKRLLDLMIHSIYTNKDIFLRELISNASDALDKRHYLSITDSSYPVEPDQLKIRIEVDAQKRTITFSDTGCGMNSEELESNLGTIARSGSLDFKKGLTDQKDVDIIGQFGVGFYSAFMVASRITVESKRYDAKEGYAWISSGEDGYVINPIEMDSVGTKIIIELKENTEDENLDEYLEVYKIKQLVKKYSDYVRYPIEMEVEVSKPSEKEDEKPEMIKEVQILNSMVPLWKRNKTDISADEYNEFYKNKFMDWENPQKTIHYSIEGLTSYNALLYIPSKAPYNFYSSDYSNGLQLYSKGVFIMDNATDLLPNYFRFVKGLIDSDDLNLNISREILQQDRQLKTMAKSIEKKIKSTLGEMLENEREEYEKFYVNFGLQLKYGMYEDYGMHKETLQDLILFYSSHEEKYVTLAEYVARMQEGQEFIYFASGDSIDQIKKLPQIERLTEKNYEVLYFMDDVDEFAINVLQKYQEKTFKSINQGDLDLDSEEQKKEKEEKTEANKSLLEAMKEALKEKVKDVKISSRLKSHPVCLVSEEGISLEMEKVLAQMPNQGQNAKAQRILEINPDHDIFNTLKNIYETKPELISDYTQLLYTQAELIEGFKIEDPIEYANSICKLMIQANLK